MKSTPAGLVLPDGFQLKDIADHAPLAYEPDFWHPAKAYGKYEPDLEGAYIEGIKYRQQHGLRTSAQIEASGCSNIAMLTDLQGDFRDGGRLPVRGTDTAVLRTGVRLLNGTVGYEYYTGVVDSQDGHPAHHISFGSRWRTLDGEPFDLRVNKAAILELEDRFHDKGIFTATGFDPNTGAPVDMGYVQSSVNVKKTIEYWDWLQRPEYPQGPIWVFAVHCKIGSDGTNLHPLISEILAFMEGARLMAPVPVHKGHIQDTDWFGPLEPCMPDPNHPQGGFQKHIVDIFAKATGRVEFFGVAQDFCNYFMQRQVMDFFEGTRFFNQMAFALDGTAAIVPEAPRVLELYKEAKDKGVHFFTHDEQFALAAA